MAEEVISLGDHTQVIVVPTVSVAPAYSANDQVGGIMILSYPVSDTIDSTAELVSVSVVDADVQNAAITLFFFGQLPTIASVDNGAFDLTDANMLLCQGHVLIPAANYQSSASNSEATVVNCGLVLKCAELATDRVYSTGKLYVVAKTTGTPTYGTTTSLQFRFSFRQ